MEILKNSKARGQESEIAAVDQEINALTTVLVLPVMFAIRQPDFAPYPPRLLALPIRNATVRTLAAAFVPTTLLSVAAPTAIAAPAPAICQPEFAFQAAILATTKMAPLPIRLTTTRTI